MVQSGETIKAKIEKKIFSTPPGSTIQLYKKISVDSGDYGGFSGTSVTYDTNPISLIGVPYSTISKDRHYNSIGLNAEGESKIAVPSDTDVEQGDLILLIPSNTLGVVEKINEYPFNDINIAKILYLKEYVGDSPIDTTDSFLTSLGEVFNTINGEVFTVLE